MNQQDTQTKKRIVAIPPTYFYLCILFNAAMIFLPRVGPTIPFPINCLGIVLIVVGTYLVLNPHFLFKKRGTPENFKPSTSVVKGGLFRYSRNPMYLGFVTLLVGVSWLIGILVGFLWPLFFFSVINWMFIPYEEEKMERECGREYLEYKKTVRRWL